LAAVALGAQIIEKHLTLDCGMTGPDHSASMEPLAFADMVRSIRRISAMLGDGIKQPNAAEKNTALVARRSVVLAKPIAAGQPVTEAHITLRRPASGIAPTEASRVLGRAALRDLAAGEVLQWSDLSAEP
jgi:N,N'-diacetyllegionaminate synthase